MHIDDFTIRDQHVPALDQALLLANVAGEALAAHGHDGGLREAGGIALAAALV